MEDRVIWSASREKGPDDVTRDFEKFAFENNCSKWREIWVTRAGCSVNGGNVCSKGFGMPKKQSDVPFRTLVLIFSFIDRRSMVYFITNFVD